MGLLTKSGSGKRTLRYSVPEIGENKRCSLEPSLVLLPESSTVSAVLLVPPEEENKKCSSDPSLVLLPESSTVSVTSLVPPEEENRNLDGEKLLLALLVLVLAWLLTKS